MRSGRSIPTIHGWEEMKQIISESVRTEVVNDKFGRFVEEVEVRDDEIVAQALLEDPNFNSSKTLQWVSVKQSEIEGFQNLVD